MPGKQQAFFLFVTAILFIFSLGMEGCTPNPEPSGASVGSIFKPTQPLPADPTLPATQAAQPVPSSTSPQMPKTLQEIGIQAETYTDPIGGLAFDYPSGWTLQSPSDEQKQNAVIYTVSLRSMAMTPGPKQQDGLPEGMTAIDITLNKQGPKTLTQAINERRSAVLQSDMGQPPVQILSEEDWVLPSGLSAHRFLYDKGPASGNAPGHDQLSSDLVLMINGQMVLAHGEGDQSLFNIISASLREIQ